MITYPVSPDARFTLYDTDTSEVVHHNQKWPQAEGLEINNSGRYRYLEIKHGLQPEGVDPRFYSIDRTVEVDVENEEYRYIYNPQRRPQEDIETAIEDVEASEFEKHVPNRKALKWLILSVASLWRQVDNQTLNAKEISLKDKTLRAASKVRKNENTAESLKALAAGGQTPDVENVWEAPDA